MSKEELGYEYFSEKGMMCSQAVLAAFRKECKLTEKDALMLGSCFATGMNRGSVCGACTGALMAIGIMFGQQKMGDQQTRINARSIADRFLKEFEEANGSCICNELLKVDVTTPEGVKYCKDNNLFKDFCPLMVMSACEILDKIVKEELSKKEN